MWNNTGSKSALRRKKSRSRRPAHKNTKPLKIKRVPAQISEYDPTQTMGAQPSSKEVIEARVILNELQPNGLYVFCEKSAVVGDILRVTLLEPIPFFFKAKVHSCQDFGVDSRVISEAPFKFRIALLYVFENELEEQRIKNFCKKIFDEEVSPAPKKAA